MSRIDDVAVRAGAHQLVAQGRIQLGAGEDVVELPGGVGVIDVAHDDLPRLQAGLLRLQLGLHLPADLQELLERLEALPVSLGVGGLRGFDARVDRLEVVQQGL